MGRGEKKREWIKNASRWCKGRMLWWMVPRLALTVCVCMYIWLKHFRAFIYFCYQPMRAEEGSALMDEEHPLPLQQWKCFKRPGSRDELCHSFPSRWLMDLPWRTPKGLRWQVGRGGLGSSVPRNDRSKTLWKERTFSSLNQTLPLRFTVKTENLEKICEIILMYDSVCREGC